MTLKQAMKRIEELEKRVKELEARPAEKVVERHEYHYHQHQPAPTLPVYPQPSPWWTQPVIVGVSSSGTMWTIGDIPAGSAQ